METMIAQALDILRGAWHRRWAGLLLSWLVALIGIIVVFRLPQNYEASARVFVDTQTVLKPLLSGLAVNTEEGPTSMLSRTLISRPNVERLLDSTKTNFKSDSQAERDRIVDNLASRLKIASLGRDNVYALSFRDENPEQAKRVVEEMLNLFMDSNLGEKREDAAQARRFIDDQIKASAQKLEEAESKMKQFKLRYIGVLGSDGKDYYAKISTLSQQIDQGRLELRSAEEARDAIKRELSGEDPVFLPDPNAPSFQTGARTGASPELDVRIETLRKNLDEMLRRFTEKHPDVISSRNVIEQLEAQRRREAEAEADRRAKAAAANPGRTASLAPIERNPVYQRLKVAFAESEAEVASARGRVQELEVQYQRLNSSAKLIPQIEGELVQLNRDYDVHKRTYETLVTRRESAEISSNLEAAGSTSTFRVIDPPRVSQFPVVPNRLLLIPLILLLALGIGAFASFVWSQVQPIFHDSRPLREITGRPLLGTVSLVTDPKALIQQRRSKFTFISGLAGLVACYGIAFVFALITSRVA